LFYIADKAAASSGLSEDEETKSDVSNPEAELDSDDEEKTFIYQISKMDESV
jgi:hypothetical protein